MTKRRKWQVAIDGAGRIEGEYTYYHKHGYERVTVLELLPGDSRLIESIKQVGEMASEMSAMEDRYEQLVERIQQQIRRIEIDANAMALPILKMIAKRLTELLEDPR